MRVVVSTCSLLCARCRLPFTASLPYLCTTYHLLPPRLCGTRHCGLRTQYLLRATTTAIPFSPHHYLCRAREGSLCLYRAAPFYLPVVVGGSLPAFTAPAPYAAYLPVRPPDSAARRLGALYGSAACRFPSCRAVLLYNTAHVPPDFCYPRLFLHGRHYIVWHFWFAPDSWFFGLPLATSG